MENIFYISQFYPIIEDTLLNNLVRFYDGYNEKTETKLDDEFDASIDDKFLAKIDMLLNHEFTDSTIIMMSHKNRS